MTEGESTDAPVKSTKKYDVNAWKRLADYAQEFAIFEALSTGKVVKGVIPVTMGDYLPATLREVLTSWEKRGWVTGYIPIFSSDAKHRFDILSELVGNTPYLLELPGVDRTLPASEPRPYIGEYCTICGGVRDGHTSGHAFASNVR